MLTTSETQPRVHTMSSQRGVTMVEMMVALIVIATVLAFGIPSFGQFRRTLLQRQAVGQVIQDIRAARQLAVTQRTPVIVSFGNGVATTNVTTYRVHSDSNDDRALQSTEMTVPNQLPRDSRLAKVSLQPTDSLLFDISGVLRSGTGGGYLVVQAASFTDTLIVSVAGMVYEK